MDMKVIIDWVANHTAFDNVWVEEGNYDWYTLDSAAQLQPLLEHLVDVADLNWILTCKMPIESMKFWLEMSGLMALDVM